MNRHGLTNIRLKEISGNDLDIFQLSFKGTYLSDRFDLFKRYLKEHTEKTDMFCLLTTMKNCRVCDIEIHFRL